MTLFIVDYVPGARGCPPLLKGELNQDIAWSTVSEHVAGLDIPDGYRFEAKHAVVDFDFWGLNMLASERFVELCERFGLAIRAVPVEMIQSGGSPAAKRYFYLLWDRIATVFDWERSEYELVGNATPGADGRYHATDLESVARFVVDERSVPAAAAFISLDAGRNLICTAEFRAAVEEAGLLGIGFRELTSYTKRDFWDA